MRLQLLAYSCLILLNCTTKSPSTSTTNTDSTQTEILSGGSEILYAHKWIVTEVQGKTVSISPNTDTAHLLFFPGQVNRVTGSTGCNTVRGSFELGAEHKMKFSPLATTKKMCAIGTDIEQSFLSALQKVTHFSVTDAQLLLLAGTSVAIKLQALNQRSETRTGAVSDEQLRRWNDLLLSGIDFTATGNEPFWSLEMDLTKSIRFKLIGSDSLTIPIVKPQPLMDVAATSYRTSTSKGIFNVIVYNQPCVNSMSGDTLPKKVEVIWNDKRYEGCGRFLSDYRLYDLWVLKRIDDSLIDAKKLAKGAPTLELNTSEHRVSGHSGCNGFGGSMEVKGRFITFGRLAGTLMACDDAGFEQRYYQLLAQKEMPYEITNGMLTIHSGASTLQYKKID